MSVSQHTVHYCCYEQRTYYTVKPQLLCQLPVYCATSPGQRSKAAYLHLSILHVSRTRLLMRSPLPHAGIHLEQSAYTPARTCILMQNTTALSISVIYSVLLLISCMFAAVAVLRRWRVLCQTKKAAAVCSSAGSKSPHKEAKECKAAEQSSCADMDGDAWGEESAADEWGADDSDAVCSDGECKGRERAPAIVPTHSVVFCPKLRV